ncbi:MAG: hypothetical protein ACYCOU_02810 [Sulfobacillus sp.]
MREELLPPFPSRIYGQFVGVKYMSMDVSLSIGAYRQLLRKIYELPIGRLRLENGKSLFELDGKWYELRSPQFYDSSEFPAIQKELVEVYEELADLQQKMVFGTDTRAQDMMPAYESLCRRKQELEQIIAAPVLATDLAAEVLSRDRIKKLRQKATELLLQKERSFANIEFNDPGYRDSEAYRQWADLNRVYGELSKELSQVISNFRELSEFHLQQILVPGSQPVLKELKEKKKVYVKRAVPPGEKRTAEPEHAMPNPVPVPAPVPVPVPVPVSFPEQEPEPEPEPEPVPVPEQEPELFVESRRFPGEEPDSVMAAETVPEMLGGYLPNEPYAPYETHRAGIALDELLGSFDDAEEMPGISEEAPGTSQKAQWTVSASEEMHGISDDASGISDDAPGISDEAQWTVNASYEEMPDISGEVSGTSQKAQGTVAAFEEMPGISGEVSGISNEAQGTVAAFEEMPGISDDAPGISNEAQGTVAAFEEMLGISDDAPGTSQKAQGTVAAFEEMLGISDDAPGISNEAHGTINAASEEMPGISDDASGTAQGTVADETSPVSSAELFEQSWSLLKDNYPELPDALPEDWKAFVQGLPTDGLGLTPIQIQRTPGYTGLSHRSRRRADALLGLHGLFRLHGLLGRGHSVQRTEYGVNR